jgi:hypothetical protein
VKEPQPVSPENPTEASRPGARWKSSLLNWSGALAAAALMVAPLWMLLGSPAVLGGHPALPALLVTALAVGLLWALSLVRHWQLTNDPQRRTPRRRRVRFNRQRSSDMSTWQLVRGIAGRLTVLGIVAGLLWLSPFPHRSAPGQALPATMQATSGTEDATSITLAPAGKATTGLVFYPGARVDAHAYQDLLQPLAAAGHLVIILKAPLGVSLLDTNQARAAMDRHPEIAAWAVGGHSLGGVSASAFAAANPDVAGLLLFASYPAANMAAARDLSVLSIAGSNDGLSTPGKIAASKSLLPPGTTFATVQGGIHAFFGDYGEQPGDGEPGTTREQAQQQIVAESLRFMDGLRTSG